MTTLIVVAAVVAWLIIAASWLRFHFDKPFAPVSAHEAAPLVVQQIDLRHIAEIISASQNNTPTLVAGAVAIVAIIAWAFVRVDSNRRHSPNAEMRRFHRHNPMAAIERPKEEFRGNLPVVRRNPFEDWR